MKKRSTKTVDAHSKMRLSVVGNCQVQGFGAALSAMWPSASVYIHQIHSKGYRSLTVGGESARQNTPEPVKNTTAAEVAAQLAATDVVFANSEQGMRAIGKIAGLKQGGVKVVLFPRISFTGLQPDMTYLNDSAGQHIRGPLGAYHSSIVAACFALGYSKERTESLFNSYIYASLGYFEEFSQAQRSLLSDASADGYDLSVSFREWLSDGPFMHTINHPKITVLKTLAAVALSKAGLVGDVTRCESLDDRLARGPGWPVYPELAERISVKGSLLFKQSSLVARRQSVREPLSLAEFISASFAAYRASGHQLITLSPRVSYTASVLRDVCNRSISDSKREVESPEHPTSTITKGDRGILDDIEDTPELDLQ